MKTIVLAVLLTSSALAQAQAKSNTIVTLAGLGCATAAGSQSFRATAWSGAGVAIQGMTGVPYNLVVDKLFDRCSITLFNVTVRGVAFSTLTLTEKDATSGAALVVIQLTGVRAISFLPAGNQNSSTPTEEVTFSWNKVLMTDKLNNTSLCYDRLAQRVC